jgi:hypothetical protein
MDPEPSLVLMWASHSSMKSRQPLVSLAGVDFLRCLMTQVADGFLNQERVETEQCLHGDRYLLELLRDDMEQLLDQLLVGDVITEDAQLTGHGVKTQ